jgi:hypothetical protein
MLDVIMHDMQQVNLYARCSVASQKMQAMLGHRGFKQVSETTDGFNILLRDVPDPMTTNYQDIYLAAVS